MEPEIEFRPRGGLYLFGIVVIFMFWIGMLAGSVVICVEFFEMSVDQRADNIKYIFMIPVTILVIIMLILQIREIIVYKIQLMPEHLFLAADRDPFRTYQKAVKIEYQNLCAIQYFAGIGLAFGRPTPMIFSGILFEYEGGRKRKINVSRFSDRQIGIIMNHIKVCSEKVNGRAIIVKEDQVNKGIKRKR